MKILLVEPGKQPRRMEIENTLSEMYRVLDCTTITVSLGRASGAGDRR